MRDLSELRRIAEGRAAEIFAWDSGTVLKLLRPGWSSENARWELAAMSAAKRAGGPVPAAIELVEVGGRTGLVLERVEGIDLLTQFAWQPWTLWAGGAQLARVHAALHAIEAPADIASLRERLRAHVETADLPPGFAAAVFEAVESLPDGASLLHGDFHPGNVIITKAGPRVIDWPNALRGDPAADVARTLLLLRLGELPPGSPMVLRLLSRVGRAIVTSRYHATYARLRPDDMARAARWELPIAVLRLAEGIPEERPKLLALIDSHLA